tara:strand:+ start:13 stop:1710 length:1698 start_codon:yes stop_codon:yes gene_type:complete
MKRLYTLILVLTSFSINAQSDTLCNPSFEDSLGNWGTFCNGNSSGIFSIDSSSAYSGNLGLEMNLSSISPPSNTCALTSCAVNLQQGKFYMISFWAKSNTSNDVLVVLQRTSAPYTNYAQKTFTFTTNWKKYQLNTTDTAAVNNLKIKIKPQSSGTYNFDDFSFYPVSILPTNTEICNGDFETGVSGWSQANSGANILAVSDSTTYQNGNFSAKIDVSNTVNGQPIFSSCKSDIEKNKKYRIHFWAKSLIGGQLATATSSLSSPPYTNYGIETFTLTTNWTEYTFISESDSTIFGNVRFAKFKFPEDGTYHIDNVWYEEIPPQPFVCDGDFETDLSNWTQTINNGAIASMSITPSQAQNGMQSAMILVNTLGTTTGSIQLTSCKTDVLKDSIYFLSFWMKGSANNLDFNAITSFASPPYTALSANSFSTYNQWTEYCYSFSHDSTIIGDIRLIKLQFLSAGTYYLDYVNVYGSDYICSPADVNEIVNDDINVFPNPSSGIININDLNRDYRQLTISNINGSVVQKLPIESLENISLDTNPMEVGIYLLQLTSKKGIITTKKFIRN